MSGSQSFVKLVEYTQWETVLFSIPISVFAVAVVSTKGKAAVGFMLSFADLHLDGSLAVSSFVLVEWCSP